MSKVYVKTLSKHRQLSQDMSDKGISVMYLKVFFYQMEITRVDNSVSKFFWEVPDHLVSIYCCSHVHYDIDVFWIHRLFQLLEICKYCHFVLKSVALAAIGGRNFHEFFEQDPFCPLPANLQDNAYVWIVLELKYRHYQCSILSAIVNFL